MKRVVPLVLVVACGGADKPAIDEPEPEDPRPAPRVIEDGEEDDDGLELQSTRGKLEPAQVEAGIAPHAAALEDCYRSRLGKRKWLGGKVELKWEVAADGALTSAQIVAADLGAWPVEKCLLDLARAMSFGAPKGGATDVSVPLEFSARGYVDVWDEDAAAAAVVRRVPELAACAEAAPDPTDVTVTVYVGTRGQVQSAGFSSPALIDDAWAECAHDLMMGWTLKDPKGKVAKLAFVYRAGETPAPPAAAWEAP